MSTVPQTMVANSSIASNPRVVGIDLYGPVPGVRGSVYVWNAANNELGTHKDLIARAVVERASIDGWRGLAVGSCGNYGLGVAAHASARRLASLVVIPDAYGDGVSVDAARHGARVVRYGRTHEDAVDHSRRLADDLGFADANVDGPYQRAALDAMGPSLGRVLGDMPIRPVRIHVPMGNGTTITSIGRALRQLGVAAGLVGVTSRGNNSVASSFTQGGHRALDPEVIRATDVNEPLCNWNALHGREALTAIRASGGSVVEADDAQLEGATRLLGDVCGLSSASPGAAGMLSAMRFARRTQSVELVVLTLSGR